MMKGITFDSFGLMVKGHRGKDRDARAVVADEITRSGESRAVFISWKGREL